MKNFTIFLTLAIIGVSAAFFRPAQPNQAPSAVMEIARGGSVFDDVPKAFVDEGLDNPMVEADQNISPARRCGFCMG